METQLRRRTLLRTAGAGLAGVAGCLGGSGGTTHGSVVLENDGDETFEVAATVVDEAGDELLDETFSLDPGDVERTDPIIDEKGTYQVRAAVGDQQWEREVRFKRDGPEGEPVYGYILVYLIGPPLELEISQTPDASVTEPA